MFLFEVFQNLGGNVGDAAHSSVIMIWDLAPEMRSGMEPRPYAKRGFVGSGFHP